MQRAAIKKTPPGYSVRSARESDVSDCNRLCRHVHGHDCGGELADAVSQGTAVVAERRGHIAADATAVGFFGHAVGQSNADLHLIASADEFLGTGILVPTRNASLLRWCLEQGLRVVQPMTLMTLGLYGEPAGAYFPSVLY
jgi:hypothetical protein